MHLGTHVIVRVGGLPGLTSIFCVVFCVFRPFLYMKNVITYNLPSVIFEALRVIFNEVKFSRPGPYEKHPPRSFVVPFVAFNLESFPAPFVAGLAVGTGDRRQWVV